MLIRFIAALAAAALLAGSSAFSAHAPVEPEEDAGVERDIVIESHLYCLALAVYFEGGSTDDSIEGQQQIARVVIDRARERRNKWGGGDICDVVFYKRAGVCQFSFACLPLARRTPRGGSRWHEAMRIASEELEGGRARPAGDMRYYMNPNLTSDRNACRFRKEFVPVGQVGRHEFFREADATERARLSAEQHAECVRYQAALTAQRLKAKLLAEKKRLAALKKKAKRSRLAKR